MTQGTDARSAQAEAYRALYRTPEWRALRKRRLNAEPNCRMCASLGRHTPATILDHIEPHRGDLARFLNPANTQPLCAVHHSSTKQRHERGRPQQAMGRDGWPT